MDKDSQDPSAPFSNGGSRPNSIPYSGEYIPPGTPTPPPPNTQQYYGNQGQSQYVLPNEKNAIMAMIFGIVGLSFCQLTAPVGWIMGAKSRKAIKESNGTLGGDGFALAGMICGIIGTVFLALGVLCLVFIVLLFGGLAIGGS
ncbi:MAG TPA: DUF4190 domain-containing protein [Acidimicrobiia bacterium]|nr:DUF4190 domain-containing protein [Acidimicrobiia bacterium]